MKKTPQPESQTYESCPEETETDLRTCSTTDCTGLIPSAITDEEMLENYQELYPWLPKAKI